MQNCYWHSIGPTREEIVCEFAIWAIDTVIRTFVEMMASASSNNGNGIIFTLVFEYSLRDFLKNIYSGVGGRLQM